MWSSKSKKVRDADETLDETVDNPVWRSCCEAHAQPPAFWTRKENSSNMRSMRRDY